MWFTIDRSLDRTADNHSPLRTHTLMRVSAGGGLLARTQQLQPASRFANSDPTTVSTWDIQRVITNGFLNPSCGSRDSVNKFLFGCLSCKTFVIVLFFLGGCPVNKVCRALAMSSGAKQMDMRPSLSVRWQMADVDRTASYKHVCVILTHCNACTKRAAVKIFF